MDDILKLRSEYEKLQEENEQLKKEKQVLEDTLYSKDKSIENLRSDVLQLNEINKRVSTRLDTISALVDIIQLINKDKSLNLPLTALAGYLQASSCHILKQKKDKTYTFLNSSINYFYPHNLKKFQNISMLKLLFPLGVVAYQFKSKTTMNISLIPNFFLYYFLTNEVISYANFGLRYLQNKNKIEDKISFFKNNAKYAYTKIINN